MMMSNNAIFSILIQHFFFTVVNMIASPQGLLKNEGKAKYGAAYRQWQIDAANFNIDGHYPVRELWERARNCWTKILTHEGKSILVVAHNAVNQALVATAIGTLFLPSL